MLVDIPLKTVKNSGPSERKAVQDKICEKIEDHPDLIMQIIRNRCCTA